MELGESVAETLMFVMAFLLWDVPQPLLEPARFVLFCENRVSVAQADLELLILLPLAAEHQGYRCVSHLLPTVLRMEPRAHGCQTSALPAGPQRETEL